MPHDEKPTLIDMMAVAVLADDHGMRLTESALDVCLALSSARAVAVFEITTASEPRLFASRRLDQRGIDTARVLWLATEPDLRAGRQVVVADRARDPRCARCNVGPASFILLPIKSPVRLEGFLYAEAEPPCFFDSIRTTRLATVTPVVRQGLTDLAAIRTALERQAGGREPPTDPLGRDSLVRLLERSDWNIAAVARTLNVTRRTIYLRLARYNLARPSAGAAPLLRARRGTSTT